MVENLFIRKYGQMTMEQKQEVRESNYNHIIFETALLTYDIENMEKPMHDALEGILYYEGIACIGRKDDGTIGVGFPTYTTQPPFDANGVPIIEKGVTLNGEQLTECSVIRANTSMYPDVEIYKRYAHQLSKVDFSESKLIQKSVCNPIPFARTQKTVDAINQALKNSGQDDTQAYINDTTNGAWNEGTENHNDFDVIDFTNIAYAEKFKYLSQYKNYLTGNLYFIMGMSSQAPTKLAQQNDSELENRDDISMILVSQKLAVRQFDMEQANKKLGTNYKYKFNELWTRSERKRDEVSRETFEENEVKEGEQNENMEE